MKGLSLLFLLGLLAAAHGAPTLLEEGRNAQAAENYQQAIELYRQAMAEHPQDAEAARALADLFTEKGLHELALPVWQEVVRRKPEGESDWLSLAQTWSYLDKNAQSVEVLTQTRERFPLSADVTQALAWMLFKTEDFQGGITLVEGFLAREEDRSLEMTLGTLYSSVFDYGRSRVHYLKSIDLAAGPGAEERNFRSIAWYNLSLLEKAFFHFELSEEAIRQSLKEEDRPAGQIALGELYQGRLDFAESRRLFEKAVQEDQTPLARYDLARLLQQFGQVKESEAQLSFAENHKDDTWIYNYGVTKDKIRRDLHELRADLHRSRYYLLDFSPRANLWDWLVWAWDKAAEGLAWWYHDQTWKNLLVKLSDSSMAARNSPEAWVSLTLAHRDRPAQSLKFLALVRDQELPMNPQARGSYLAEEGVIGRDPRILEQALKALQRPWENDDRARAVAVLAEEKKRTGRTAEHRQLLNQLYLLNPGGVAVRGWALPVKLGIYGPEAGAWKQAWETYASQTGWDASTADRPGVEWTLDWQTDASGAVWTLRDGEGNAVRSGSAKSGSNERLAELAQVFRSIHSPR